MQPRCDRLEYVNEGVREQERKDRFTKTGCVAILPFERNRFTYFMIVFRLAKFDCYVFLSLNVKQK